MKKTRIQLLDENYITIEDRLVAQDSEFYNGPKVQHEGPLKIELSLFQQEDVESAIEYLKKLTGMLPLAEKKVKGKKPIASLSVEDEINFITNLIEENPLGDVVNRLYDEGFVFISGQFLKDYCEKKNITLTLADEDLFDPDSDYFMDDDDEEVVERQILIKRLKQAVNPYNDKFDFKSFISLPIHRDDEEEDIKVLLYSLTDEPVELQSQEWGKTEQKTKKAAMVFPPFMTEDDRDKFRQVKRRLELDPSKITSSNVKSYNRWCSYVKIAGVPLEPITLPTKED